MEEQFLCSLMCMLGMRYINTLNIIYRISNMFTEIRRVNSNMGCGCYGSGYQRARSFLTKEERISMLKEYQDEIDKEKQGVSERIKELEAS
jgi:hypothetical protein